MPNHPKQPRPLLVAAAAIAVETVALAASAVGLAVYQALGHHPHDALDSWLVVGFAALGAGALGFGCRGLLRHRRWARSLGVLVQLLALPVAVNTFGNGVWWVAAPLLVCGVLGLGGLFAPSTTQLFVGAADDYSSTSRPSRS